MTSDLSLAFLRVVEQAAIACAHTMGQGDGPKADRAAVEAMRRELDRVPIDGTIVIGEGERDEAPMLLHRRAAGPDGGARRRPGCPGRHRRRSARGHEPVRHRRAGRDCRARRVRAGRAPARAGSLHGEADRPAALARRGRSRCARRRQPARHRAFARPRYRRSRRGRARSGRVTRGSSRTFARPVRASG